MPPRPAPSRTILSALLAGALVVGCTQFPELDARNGPEVTGAAYPSLVPVEGLLARAEAPRITPATGDAIDARVAALRARADRLRRPVVDRDTRARMRAGVPG